MFKFKKSLSTLLVAGAVATTASSAFAATTDGEVNLKIQVPEVVVLYHWDEANIIFHTLGGNAVTKGNGNVSKTEDITATSVIVTGDLNTDSTINNEIDVTLQGAWAVRSLTNSGNVSLSVQNAHPNHTLNGATDNNDVSKITTKDVKLAAPQANTAPVPAEGENIELASQWAPTKGDIKFKMDLTKLKKSGWHYNAGADKTFKLILTYS